GDHGFDMGLSRRIPELIFRHLRGWVETWLDRQGPGVREGRAWAVPPGRPKILEAVENSLSLAPNALDVSRGVLADHGNMSSPTVLFILERMRRWNAPRPCVALGFGPGMVVEAALFVKPRPERGARVIAYGRSDKSQKILAGCRRHRGVLLPAR